MNLIEAHTNSVTTEEITEALAELATNHAISMRILEYVMSKFAIVTKQGKKVGVLKVNKQGYEIIRLWLSGAITDRFVVDDEGKKELKSFFNGAEIIIDESVPNGHVRVYPRKP